MIERKCIICNEYFTKKNIGCSKTCSKKCSIERKKFNGKIKYKNQPINCIVCNNIFTKCSGGSKTCSKKCSIENRNNKTNKNIISNCIICNKNFRKFGGSITCSKKCSIENCKNYQSKYNKNIISNCIICNKNFKKIGGSITCSKECSIERKKITSKKCRDKLENKLKVLEYGRRVYVKEKRKINSKKIEIKKERSNKFMVKYKNLPEFKLQQKIRNYFGIQLPLDVVRCKLNELINLIEIEKMHKRLDKSIIDNYISIKK